MKKSGWIIIVGIIILSLLIYKIGIAKIFDTIKNFNLLFLPLIIIVLLLIIAAFVSPAKTKDTITIIGFAVFDLGKDVSEKVFEKITGKESGTQVNLVSNGTRTLVEINR